MAIAMEARMVSSRGGGGLAVEGGDGAADAEADVEAPEEVDEGVAEVVVAVEAGGISAVGCCVLATDAVAGGGGSRGTAVGMRDGGCL